MATAAGSCGGTEWWARIPTSIPRPREGARPQGGQPLTREGAGRHAVDVEVAVYGDPLAAVRRLPQPRQRWLDVRQQQRIVLGGGGPPGTRRRPCPEPRRRAYR